MTCASLMHLLLVCALFLGSAFKVVADKNGIIYNECPDVDIENITVSLTHENDCTRYYQCSGGKKYLKECPIMNLEGKKLYFNPILQDCDWPQNVKCEQPEPKKLTNVKIDIPTKCPKVDSIHFTVHLAHETDCTKFYKCNHGKKVEMDCPLANAFGDKLHFNAVLQVCDWPKNAGCDTSDRTTPSLTNPSSTTSSSTTSSSTNPSSTTSSSTTSSSTNPSSTTSSSTTSSSTISSLTTPSSTSSSSMTPSSTTASPTTPSSTTPAFSNSYCIGTCPGESDLTYIATLPHKEDCTKYCLCENGIAHVMDCPSGLSYDESKGICDFPSDGECDVGTTPDTPTPETPTPDTPTPETPTPETPTPETPTPDTPTPETPTPDTPTPDTPAPDTPTPETPTPETPTPDGQTPCKGTCPSGSDFTYIPTLPHKEHCTKYCLCVNGIAHVMDCPSGLSYDESKGICDFRSDGECDIGTTPNTPTPETPTPETPTPDTPTSETPTPDTPTPDTPTPETPTPDTPTSETPTPDTPTPDTPTPETPTPNTPTPDTQTPCKGTCPSGNDFTYIPTLPHKEHCTKYCLCVSGIAHVMDCPLGLSYDESKGICDFPSDGECDIGTTPNTPTPNTPTPDTPTLETPTPETPTPETPTPDTPTSETPTPDTPTPETPTPETPTPETPTPETPTPETPTPETPTVSPSTPEVPSNNSCIGSCPKTDPMYAIHLPNEECTKFCECSNGKAYVFVCPSGLHFSPTLSVCTKPKEAKCANVKYRPKPSIFTKA